MLKPQMILPLADELVVDLFAGGGGASTGIEQAIGRHVDIAVNHDPAAVALHQANHPQTQHFVSDVFEVDPLVVTDGRPVGLLWASPDCKHFSKAKGGKPVSKKIRGLAWVVIKWAKLVRPRVICLENVEEFQTWGPLLADGMPCPDRKGKTFQRWVAQLRNLGYAVQWKELRACDFGAPTIRKRLFLVARCDGQPIVWPAPTHAQKPAKGSDLKPWRTAAECIDWSLPCPSIFERGHHVYNKQSGQWEFRERPLAEATMRRIAHGVRRYVLEAAQPFVVHIAHGDGKPGGVQRWGTGAHDIGKPLPTLTAKAEHCLAVPTLVQTGYGERPGQAPRVPGLDKPLGTAVDGQKHGLVAAFLAKHYGGVVGSDLRDGIGTVTSVDHHSLVAANIVKNYSGEPTAGRTDASLEAPAPTVMAGGAKHSLVTSSLVKLRGTSNSAATDAPLGTVSAQGFHHAEVRAFLIRYFGSDQDPRLDGPLHTVTTKHRDAIVTVHGEEYFIADIGMRMLQPRELYRAQGFPDSYVIDRGADGRALTKAEQVRMCGNSVCPPIAAALVRANYADRQAVRRAA